MPLVLIFVALEAFISAEGIDRFVRKNIFSVIVVVALLICWGDQEFSAWLIGAHLVYSAVGLVVSKKDNKQLRNKLSIIERLQLQPAQFVALSFLFLVSIGALLLELPISAISTKSISFVDALFTATSAVCVTGLSTISVIDNFSLFGQVVILLLIQVGGLGIMTLQSLMTILIGKSLGVKDRFVMQDLLDLSDTENLWDLVLDIVKYTFIIELWGIIVLTIAFSFEGFEFGRAFYLGFFHSISAFCNAGFALFNNSLESFASKPLIHGTIAVLIMLGGLGFIVLKELRLVFSEKRRFVHFALHTKIVLTSTIALIVVGTFIIFFGEYLNGLDGYSFFEKLQVSLFQSITLRTAGFNSMPLGSLHAYTIYLMMIFMFIGAGPGSTAGGIKVTTFAILIQSIRSTLKGQSKVEFFNRTIPSYQVVRATALAIISLITISLFILLLIKVEPEHDFLSLIFEVVSAFGTVGLSLGLTPHLSVAGKLVITLMMFIGRVGPLTMILAIGQKNSSSGKFDYPKGRIMIG